MNSYETTRSDEFCNTESFHNNKLRKYMAQKYVIDQIQVMFRSLFRNVVSEFLGVFLPLVNGRKP